MLSIAIGSISLMITWYILKKLKHDLAMFEFEILSLFSNDENEASSSYKAIKQALKNKPNIDK